jgi:G3E family GTPase
VLTGFLGSGKTTLLAELLRDPRGERIAVIVNEVGELSLDHWLLEEVAEDVVALPSGCVCCTMRGELYEALERVLPVAPTRIVVETTGVADPAPILHGLGGHPRMRDRVRVAGVCAVVDADRAEGLLDAHPEVRRQLDLADRAALTKTDLAGGRVPGVRALLEREAPGCDVREAPHGRVDPAWLLDSAPIARVRGAGDASAWLHHAGGVGPAGGGPPVGTHAVELPQATDVERLELWLRLVTQVDGDRLLRVKGLVEEAGTGDVYVLQSAGHAVSPPRRLAGAPAGHRGVRLVLLEPGLGAAAPDRRGASRRQAGDGTRAAP